MADAPVGGQDSEAETGKPARIPVSEPPEVEPDGAEEAQPPGAGAGGAEDAEKGDVEPEGADDAEGGEEGTGDAEQEPAARSQSTEDVDADGDDSEDSDGDADDDDSDAIDGDAEDAEPASESEPEPKPEPEPAAELESGSESEPEQEQADADAAEVDPAAATQIVKPVAAAASPDAPTVSTAPVGAAEPAAPAKPAFDAFAPKSKPAQGSESAPAAAPKPIPVSEAPDLEEEAEAEAAEAERSGLAAPTTPLRVPVAEAADAAEEQDAQEPAADAAAETMVVSAETIARLAQAAQDEESAAPDPALLTPGSDETTLIPKVPEKPTESTTVMPSVGGDGSGDPDAQATRLQPAVPGGPAAPSGGNKKGRGYRPPEFHAVDPGRSQLPPPQNFKLDRRELDEDGDGGQKHVGRRALLIGGVVVVAGAAGLTAAGVIKLPGTGAPKMPTVGFAPATNSGASSATQTGTAFLTAWQNGQFEVAANITDDPAAALKALKAYKKNLGVVGMVMNPNASNAVGWMTYAVTMQGGAPMGQWQYNSGFATYSKEVEGFVRWFVKWDPAILYTSLKAGYQLQIKKTPATIKGLVDRNNQPIDPAAHPSLASLVSTLMTKSVASGATDGQDIIMTDAKGNQLAKVTTLTPPINNGTVPTTLDMKVQTAAEAAVIHHDNSSMVVIQPSTGHILAIANNTGAQYYDQALVTQVAPGSTFKILTSTALLSKGLTTLNSDVPCPTVLIINGQPLHNSEGEAGDYTYEMDFATSCNNAFSSFWDHSGMTKDLLSDTAKKYFGLNQKWDIGLGEPTQYMNVPGGLSGGGLAESLVGQGDVLATPLAMCSVGATVANGSFKQPIILPKQQQLTATPLGPTLQGHLKTLMSSVISEGTAASVGFPRDGHYFAKTGTAEVGSGASLYNNSWFVVFNDQHDIAICARAIRGGAGAATAAPECLTVFQRLGYV